MNAIGVERVREVLNEIISEVPETYTYTERYLEITGEPLGWDTPDCKYVLTDETGGQHPGCLVGVVLDRLGLDYPSKKWNQSPWSRVPMQDVFTPQANFLLRDVQAYQDNGCTWHEAVNNV